MFVWYVDMPAVFVYLREMCFGTHPRFFELKKKAIYYIV